MTSLTIDDDGIEPVVFAPNKMDSLDVDVISDTEWKQFAHNMQIDPQRMQQVAKFCNPKLLRRFFSSNTATEHLHRAAKLGKIDVMKVLLSLDITNVNKIDNAGQTALHYAVQEGHLDIVSMLLKQEDIDASTPNKYRYTALHDAANYGNVLVFEKILKAPTVDVKSTTDFGETALVMAAREGHEKVVDMLLKVQNVQNVVVTKDHISTPLHEAAANGHVGVVKMILARMDVNSTNHCLQQSPLHLAVQSGHENVVDVLLQARTIDLSLKDCYGDTPLHIATREGDEVIFEKLLQMPKVDVNSANDEGKTALHIAAENKHANIVMKLLDMPDVDPCAKTEDDTTPIHMTAMFGGVDVVQVETRKVDVNITDSKKRTAIHWATKRGHLNVVEVLLGVPTVAPFLGDHNDNTPLHLAAKLGHQDIAKRLLAVSHLDVNKVNKKNKTPLFLAARHGSIHVVDLLLKNREVDLSICDHHGNSPFHTAVKGGHATIAEKLITTLRAVPIHSNKDNVTALHVCIRGGHENLVDILLKQSTLDASAKDVCGNFPIHYAAQYGNTCIFQKILNTLGVDVNSVNDHQDTALHVAAKAGHVDVVHLLLQVPTLNANMRDRDGNSALHVAVKYGEEEIIEKLLKADGVDVNAKGKYDVTPLELALEEGHAHIIDRLLEVQGVLNNEGGSSAEEGQGKPCQNDSRILSLLLAARNGHDTIVKSLLARGVDVNGNCDGLLVFTFGSALHEAIVFGHPKVVEVLLKDQNIDPNRRNSHGIHPLVRAAKNGQKAIVEELMKTGQIGVNVLSHDETALQGAAGKGDEQIVNVLLKTPGINVHIKNRHGETALFYAARAYNKTILKEIYNASKIDIDDRNDEGESIIHLAAREDLLNVFGFLLEVVYKDVRRSVDVNLKTSPPKDKKDGFTPQSALEIAINTSHYAVIEELTKFDNVNFTQEVVGKDGMTAIQHLFNLDGRKIYNIVRRTPQVTDFIEALYKDRQASVDAANAILVGAALIASVTFASWLQPPLGYTTYYHEQFSDSLPAPPIVYPEYAAFDHHPSLQAFWVFNSLSFFSAIATVISGARSVLPNEELFIKEEVEKLRKNLFTTSILLGLSMFFVLLAFAIAGVVVLPPMIKFRSNIFSTIGIGGSMCFIFLFLFGYNIYKLHFRIKSSKASKKGFWEKLGFKPWHMLNPFTRSRSSKDHDSI